MISPVYINTLSYYFLEVAVFMVFLYGIKRKTFAHNVTGFVTVCFIGIAVISSHVVPGIYLPAVINFLGVILLLFIVFYGVYKVHKRNCKLEKIN